MIAGETSDISAILTTATGFTGVVSPDTGITADAYNTVKGDDGYKYSSSVSLSKDYTALKGAIVLSLTAKDPDISVNVSPENTELIYGYTYPGTFTATVSHDANNAPDTTVKYKYTYEWQVRQGEKVIYTTKKETSDPVELTDKTESIFKDFPTKLSASTYTNGIPEKDYYKVQCVVTAIRQDNGKEITSDVSWDTSNKAVAGVVIKRADFTAKAFLDGWTYGDKRNAPEFKPSDIERSDGNGGTPNVKDDITYRYAKIDGDNTTLNWTTDIPTNAGDYYVGAIINEKNTDPNFNSLTVDVKPIPTNLVGSDTLGDITVTGNTATKRGGYKAEVTSVENKNYTLKPVTFDGVTREPSGVTKEWSIYEKPVLVLTPSKRKIDSLFF